MKNKTQKKLESEQQKCKNFFNKKPRVQNDNSVTDSINTFKVILPENKIASKMELGKDKLKYVFSHGIAPQKG